MRDVDEAPAVIAGYPVIRLLGRGGMGTVFLVRHPRIGRLQALKVITPTSRDSDLVRQRFMREAEVGSSFEHPSLVTVYDQDEHDGVLFLSMQWVDGVDLASLVRSDRAPVSADVAAGVRQIAGALDVLHREGHVHRDVKCSNVLVARPRPASPDVRWVLADFGIARALDGADDLTGSAFIGSVPYAAPELFEREHGSVATDVYALACVAAEVLTGHLPFGATPAQVIGAHDRGRAPRGVDQLPKAVAAVLRRGLATAPTQRPETAGAFGDALAQALVPRQVTASTPSRASQRRAARPPREKAPAAAPPDVADLATVVADDDAATVDGTELRRPRRRRRRRFPTGTVVAAAAALLVAGGATWWLDPSPGGPVDPASESTDATPGPLPTAFTLPIVKQPPPWSDAPLSLDSTPGLEQSWAAAPADLRAACPLVLPSSTRLWRTRVASTPASDTSGAAWRADVNWISADYDELMATVSGERLPEADDEEDLALAMYRQADMFRYADGSVVAIGFRGIGTWVQVRMPQAPSCLYTIEDGSGNLDGRDVVQLLRLLPHGDGTA